MKQSLQEKINQFANTEIKYDESLLNNRQKIVVEKLYEAAKIMDEIFLDQVYAKNIEIKNELEKKDTNESRLVLNYFNIMFGPFDRLDDDKPFYGQTEKPAGANFYPEDMTKEEFLNWVKDHPEDEKAFTSEFTMIRRDGDKLIAIPYSEYYAEPLKRAAALLNEAAEYTDNLTLKKYLLTRAAAFLSNNYYESDMAWMDLKDHTIEIVIGPYEVYEDELFNYKAAFECFLTIKDPLESKKLDVFAQFLDDIERNLPNAEEDKNFNRGSESPMMVVQEIFSAGDTKAGVQTLAFNLPNDERVREAKGSKKVMLKNMHEAKFEKQLIPIAKIVLNETDFANVTFDAFFNHTLMHEMSHGVGPGKITIDGRETEVKKELKETYSKIEECKADVLGMYNNVFMIEKSVYPKEFEKTLWPTFLAGIFRSIRFGISEAHGAGNAIIFNYLLENGAYAYDASTQKLSVNEDKIYSIVKDLANKILVIQASGDYEGAKALIEQYAVETEPMRALVKKLNTIPVDIRPIFQIEQTLGL
ncbi:MAG TPA: peptidase [Caldithrix sp.]|nr:peptidase [Calditrichaceae bacterium]HEM48588.1 peptidase [Caldithrix sp.]HES59516.1 peptidase [Caldithrix sp.]